MHQRSDGGCPPAVDETAPAQRATSTSWSPPSDGWRRWVKAKERSVP